MQIKQNLRTVVVVVVGVVGLVSLVLEPIITAKPYPDCGTSTALVEIAKLYDNRRLLHAVAVSDARLRRDSLQARYCIIKVKWGNGSESSVNYEFDRYGGGRGQATYLQLWIDYNGGMRGPLL